MKLLNRKRVRRVTRYFNSEKGLKNIPYGLGARLIDWFCSTDFALNTFFKKKTPILKEFLAHFPDKYDEKETTIKFLRTNFLHGWRATSFSNLPDKKYKRRLELKGYDNFLEHYKKGKGVVLINSHFGLPSVVLSLMPALGYDNFHSIVGENFTSSAKFNIYRKNRTPKLLIFDRAGQSDLVKQLFESKEILEAGGILNILADGMFGRANANTYFLGKKRGFRSTFAELGMISESSIIPVFAYAHKGKMHVEFHDALNMGEENMDHEDKIQMIIEQYSQVLEKKWEEQPYLIMGGFMDMYNKQFDY